MDNKIEITFLTAEGCSSLQQTVRIIDESCKELQLNYSLRKIVIQNAEQAVGHQFLGSPSIRINDNDIELESHQRHDYGLG